MLVSRFFQIIMSDTSGAGRFLDGVREVISVRHCVKRPPYLGHMMCLFPGILSGSRFLRLDTFLVVVSSQIEKVAR